MLPHKRKVIVRVHPPEAEAIANAYSTAYTNSSNILARLAKVQGVLDQEWEGRQKSIFTAEFEKTVERLRNYILPILKNREQQYRHYMADKEIEETQYY